MERVLARPDAPVISLREAVAGAYGDLVRSSGVFYFKQGKDFTTTISFLDYWRVKNNMKVALFVTIREMSGALISRRRLSTEGGLVVNFKPEIQGKDECEGSVEIEAFGLENMRIPYAAAMVVYETPKSVTMVHGYTRSYSPHEIEEKRTLCHGEEACWTLRDSKTVGSFAFFHNGAQVQPAQTARLVVRNERGQTREERIALPALAPYETVRVAPADHVPGLADFLGGSIGSASLSFDVNGAFTRLLVGNRALDDSDWQVTHSNFNYAVQKLDYVEGPGETARMGIPALGNRPREVIIYPDCAPGAYSVCVDGRCLEFRSGELPRIDLSGQGFRELTFRKEDGPLPTRIVTGLAVSASRPGLLPAECSLGTVNKIHQRKRFWWGPCAVGPRFNTWLALNGHTIYGEVPAHAVFVIRLYAEGRHDHLETRLTGKDLARLQDGVAFDELFAGAAEFLGGKPGWWSLFCGEYFGLTCLALLEKKSGGLSLEHAF